jgi:short-subunit dehydrogenase
MPLFAPLNRPIRDWRGLRVWIVGASSGIGAALARALAARGAWVAVSARGREALEAVAADCGEAAVAEAMDVTVPEDFVRVRDALLARWGRLDLVVLNAGTYRPLRAWALTPQAIRDTLRTNLVGAMDGVAALAPMFSARGSGAIALVGSVAGYGGLPKAAVYGPSKAALINFAETLYLDLAPRGVSVFLVNPGFVATPLTAQNDFRMPALLQPEQAAEAIVAGFGRGAFEIHFPKRFTGALKLLRLLPRRIYFALIRSVTGL